MWKKRVLSIILIAVTFISILPVEQASAADDIPFDIVECIENLGIWDLDWVVRFEDSKPTRIYREEGKSEKELDSTLLYESECSMYNVSTFTGLKSSDAGGLQHLYNYKVSTLSGDSGKDLSTVVGWGFPDNYSAVTATNLQDINNNVRKTDGYSLAEMSGTHNVYCYEIVYTSQNKENLIKDSTNDGFVVYRSYCNYDSSIDKFYYGVVIAIQTQSSLLDMSKDIYIAGGCSPELRAYGLDFEYDDHSGLSVLKDTITAWCNSDIFYDLVSGSASTATKDIYALKTNALDSKDTRLQIVTNVTNPESLQNTLSGFACENDLVNYKTTALALTYSLGYGESSHDGLISNIHVALDDEKESALGFLFPNKDKEEVEEGYEVFEYNIQCKKRYTCCEKRPYGTLEGTFDKDANLYYDDYFVNAFSRSKNDMTLDLNNAKVPIKKEYLAFGETLKVNADEGSGGFWSKVTNITISNSLILKAESSLEAGSAVQLGNGAFYKIYPLDNVEMYPDYIIPGIEVIMHTVSAKLDEINYQSDTGDRILEYVEQLISNSDVEIEYDSYSDSLVDWRILSYSTKLKVSNVGDLVYLIGYINLLKEELDVSQITVLVNNSKIVIMLDEHSTLSGSWVTAEGCIEEPDNVIDDATGFYHINDIKDAISLFADEALISPAIEAVNSSYLRYKGAIFQSTGGSDILPSIEIDEDLRLFVENTIKACDGDFMYTGTAMNSLSYAYANIIYGLFEEYYGIGAESLAGFDKYTPFDAFMRYPYSRSDALEKSVYPGDYTDYLARIPVIGTRLPAQLQVLLYNIDYGLNVLDWSSYADENETSSVDVSNWLNFEVAKSELENIIGTLSMGNMTALEIAESGVYDNVPDIYMNIFKIIINVHQVCDYLAELDTNSTGLEIAKGWSGSVYNFYKLYEATYSGGIDGKKFFNSIEGNLLKVEMEDFTYSNKVEPLGFVIRFGDEQLSTQWKYGYAISSHYVPFQTNLYELSSIEAKANDSEWITEFYYKYGFYRKALYVTTDPEATVNRVLTGRHSGTKVATLRDLLSYEHDIELYVDQQFYNADDLDAQLSKYTESGGLSKVFGSMFDAVTLTSDSILKTREYANYSQDIQANVKPLEAPEMNEEDEPIYKYDQILLSGDDILGTDGYLSSYEYSIQQSYGVISAIYRDSEIFTEANRASVSNEPVFVSSKNVVGVQKDNYSFYRMFYNYLTLSSLENILSKETTLLVDLDAPIFIDMFGNIVTADGYVIIPATANATLSGEQFTPYSVGYATFVANAPEEIFDGLSPNFYDWLYGSDYEYLCGRKSISSRSKSFRERCQDTGGGYMYLLNNGDTSMGTTTLTDGVASATIIWSNLNTRLAVLKNLLLSIHFLNAANFYDSQHINLILETLRGAPIEFIDFQAEGLETNSADNKFSAYVAYKFEQIMNAIHTDSNGTIKDNRVALTFSIIDIFHIESAEKIALLAVKCLLIGFLLLLAAMIVADATVGKMPIKIVGNIIVTCVLTGLCISLIPVLTELSLSTVTKKLMQAECSEMLAMQAQRNAQGMEIGVTQTYPVSSSTDIILHVGSLDVTWYDKLLYSAYSSIDNSFEDLYDERAYGIPIANAPYTIRRGKELYMDTGVVMASTVLQYDATKGLLTNSKVASVDEDMLSASYILPYYVILDQLVANVNIYNEKNAIQPMNYSVNADGSIRTQDLCYAYFNSPEFLGNDYDILDMARWFGFDTDKVMYAPYYTQADMDSFALSYWYPLKADSEYFKKSVEKLYEKARAYVTNNSEMLNYVSDAAYLKSFAMYLAVQYNNIFGVGVADAFEVKCIDTADLLRYVVGTPNDVYKYANRTLPRFAHESGGGLVATLGLAAYATFCLTNVIRVISFIMCYITCCASIVYHRVIKREMNAGMLGFLVLIGELTILNTIFAVIVKVSINLTRWGVSPTIAALIVMLVNLGIALAFGVMSVRGVKEVTHIGKAEIDAMKHFFNNIGNRLGNVFSGSGNESGPERSVGVLQAHDFSRVENDNYMNTDRDTNDLAEHDRRRESGELDVS